MRIRDMLYMIMQKVKALSQKEEWLNLNPSSSNVNNGLLRAWRDPIKKTVRIEGYFSSTSNLTSSDILFVLPEGWRPSTTFGVPAMFTTNTATASYYVTVNQNGNVTQTLSSTTRMGFFSGTIDLA